MLWVSLLRTLLGIAASVATYVQQRQLMDAGRAEQINKALSHANENIKKANRARDAAERDFDKRDGVPDNDDPNLRD
jgi:hypothetical protein